MSHIPEDHYAILGVPRDAKLAELRRAYRRLALQYHPDRAGAASTRTFQRIASAYDILSNPEARAKYDRQLGSADPKNARHPSSARPPVEREGGSPVPPARATRILLSRLTGPLASLIACGVAQLGDDGIIELRLTETERVQGGWATISTRAPVSCRPCAGSGSACPRCEGKGTVIDLVSAWLSIPPHVSDGMVLPVVVDSRTPPLRFRIRSSSS